MNGTAQSLGIQHVFVLMLENRSFDHLLGFSGITGTDAATGAPARIDGLSGSESNLYDGQSYLVQEGADYRMPIDPNHEFQDVLLQLCGPNAVYSPGGPYPPADNSGFVASYIASGGGRDPGEIMKCYRPGQLPVLNALAREFVACDNWHASLPGPTWPNRMFVHGASSGGLDHSPATTEIVAWETVAGFPLPNGTIFDLLSRAGVTRRLYGGDDFPMVAALKGIHLDDIRHYSLFASDLAQPAYPYRYIFIEPCYDELSDYRNGDSQHPLADVTKGEALIKSTYEAIRNSAVWPDSLLIVTWDEHGGFYDHAGDPPPAVPPGDSPDPRYNRNGFAFDRYGPRVPAVVISPRIPRNLIDHRVYDHASIPATLESLFGLPALTARDASANRLDALVTLPAARADCPATLPAPAAAVTRPDDSADRGNLPAILHAAMRQEITLAPERADEIARRVAAIGTRADARQYLDEVRAKIHPRHSHSARS